MWANSCFRQLVFGAVISPYAETTQQIRPQTSSPKSDAMSNAMLKTATVSKIQPGIDQAS